MFKFIVFILSVNALCPTKNINGLNRIVYSRMAGSIQSCAATRIPENATLPNYRIKEDMELA